MGIVTSQLVISLDGYLAGPNQSIENPMGDNGGAPRAILRNVIQKAFPTNAAI